MSIFNQLFHKNPEDQPLADFSAVATDIHSHLIPGIDDGSDKMETSLQMIRGFEELGYSKMITTPHIMADFYKNTPEIILPGLERLRQAVADAGLKMKIEAAAEYNIDDGFEKHMNEGKLLTFGDKFILIELSTFVPHPQLHAILFNLQLEGYKVMLAHAERYSYWYNDMKGYIQLRDREVYFQVNLMSFVNKKGDLKKIAERLASLDMIDFLGSDMHSPNSMQFYKACLSEKWVMHLVRSGRLLNHTL